MAQAMPRHMDLRALHEPHLLFTQVVHAAPLALAAQAEMQFLVTAAARPKQVDRSGQPIEVEHRFRSSV